MNKNKDIKQLQLGNANSANSVRNMSYVSLSCHTCEHNIETYDRFCY